MAKIYKKIDIHLLLQNFFKSFPRLLGLCARLMPMTLTGISNGYKIKLDLREYHQRSMYLNNYAPVQTDWVKQILKPGSTFIDIGANSGYFTLLAASLVKSSGQVLAFEPSPSPTNKIKKLTIPWVDAIQIGIGDIEEDLDLYLQPKSANLHSPSFVKGAKFAFEKLPQEEVVKVSIRKLDNLPYIQKLSRIDLVKIDTQGFEQNAIKGMVKTIKTGKIKYLMVIFCDRMLSANGSSFDELMSLIKGLGFKIHSKTSLQEIPSSADTASYSVQYFLFEYNDY